MGEMTIDQQTAQAPATTHTGPDALVAALLAVVDGELAAGPGRQHVLSAALEVALLEPETGWIAEARTEVLAEHAATVAAVRRIPAQRGADDTRHLFVEAADVLRDRRLEALDLALGLVGSDAT